MRSIINIRSLAIVLLLSVSACTTDPGETTTMGAATGGVLGAGLGAIVGNQTGSPGAGLVIGAVAGASAGAAVGNALEAQQQAVRTQDEAIERQEKLIKAQTTEISELRAMKLDAAPQDSAAIDQRLSARGAYGTRSGNREYLPDMSSPGSAAVRGVTPERQASASLPIGRASASSMRERTLTEPSGTYEGSTRGAAHLDEESVPSMRQAAREPEAKQERIFAHTATNHTAGAIGSTVEAVSPDPSDMRASLNSARSGASVECKTAADEFGQSQRAYDNSQKLFHLRRALRLCPDEANYHNALGELYSKLNRSEDAKFEFREALRLNPAFEPAKQNLRTTTNDTNEQN